MEEAVAVAGGGERPQPLRGARLGPPVQPAALLQGDQRGDLDQVPLEKVSEVVCNGKKMKKEMRKEKRYWKWKSPRHQDVMSNCSPGNIVPGCENVGTDVTS